jgi:hypothetical protein
MISVHLVRRLALVCLVWLTCALSIFGAAQGAGVDDLRLDQVRILGSHNSYRPYPSSVTAQRLKTYLPKDWMGLMYGHPPLESQLALGLHQFEIDVAPDAEGGLYAEPYAEATPETRALMAAPGAKVVHIAGLDYDVHCLTFRACLGIFARWSNAHPAHDPIVILVNSVDADPVPGLWPHAERFSQTGIDELNTAIAEVIGPAHILAPDEVLQGYPTLRAAVMARAWPKVSALRGKFVFILDGNEEHEAYLKTGHPSLAGRVMFGWFGEAEPEAAVFNIGNPLAEQSRIRKLVSQGFIVRTRADEAVVEARQHDGSRMKAALASGAQIVSTDFYAGVPDPQGLGYISDFEGGYLRCDEATASC